MMPNDRPYQRRSGDSQPVSTGEVARWMARHEQASDQMHRDLTLLINKQSERTDKLDERTDRLATRVAIIFAVVTVLWSIVLVLAPFIRTVLDIPT